jgi:hypothetical protein
MRFYGIKMSKKGKSLKVGKVYVGTREAREKPPYNLY